MAITQIPMSGFPVAVVSNEITVRPESSDLTDRDERRRREAKRAGNQLMPRMRQAQQLQQLKQAQHMSDVMLKEHAASVRSPTELLTQIKLKNNANDHISKNNEIHDNNELLKSGLLNPEPGFSRVENKEKKYFQNSDKVEFYLPTDLLSKEEPLFEIDKFTSDQNLPVKKLQPSDMVAMLADLGSTQGKGKINFTVRQMTQQLKDIVDLLAAQRKAGTELNEEECAQLACSADFLEGYCENSVMDAQTRAQLDASLQSLRSNLSPVIQVSIAETNVANSGSLGLALKPASVVGSQQRATREGSLKGSKEEGGTRSLGGGEGKHRAVLTPYDENKQTGDTLPLIVQRSV